LDKLNRLDTLQNILVILDSFLLGTFAFVLYFIGNESRVSLLHSRPNSLSPLLKHLNKEDEFIQLITAKMLVVIISKTPIQTLTLLDSESSVLLSWISLKLQHSNPSILDIVVQYIQTILSVPTLRLACYNQPNLLELLYDILIRNSSNAQMQYQIIYCLWLMSFNEYIAGHLDTKVKMSIVFVDIAKNAIKEKVVRVIVGTFKVFFIIFTFKRI
jgi:V-type H+-transporting ATPase subunit H